MIKIDKGIPIPCKDTRCEYPFAELEIGDSFLIPIGKRNSAVSTACRYKPKRFTTRITEDKKHVRVWRVE